MKKLLIFILGLAIGAGASCAYNRYVLKPQIIAETRSQAIAETKTQIDAELAEKERILSGIVASVSGNELTLRVEEENGTMTHYNILTDESTKLTRIQPDDIASEQTISWNIITPGSYLTVVASEPIDSLNVYAQEITLL